MAVSALPLYPSAQAWKDLSPSQRARLEESIASALQVTLDLPLDKQDVSATRAFVASYAKNTAQASLDAVIWQTGNDVVLPTNQRLIRRRTFELARRLSTLPSVGLTPETLVDLTIVFSPRNTSRLRALWEAVLDAQPQLLDSVADDVIPSFIALLQPATIAQTGLYGVRKAAHCVSCFIHCAPSRLLARFVQNQSFVLVLARAYDEGLSSISQSYGGIQRFEGSATQQDDWEPVWMATKTALLDTFHTLLTHVLAIVAVAAPGAPLASASDHAFALVFALLDLPSAGARGNTPFYDQPLIADYQHAYDIAKTLGSALRRADAGRTDALDAVLRSLDVGKGPGALKLLLRSSSVASGAASARAAVGSSRGAQEVAAAGPSGSGSSQPIAADPMLEAQVEQVRELFPDHSAAYVRALLVHPDYPFHGSAEKVIEALLEGHAPPPEEIEPAVPATAGVRPVEPDAAWAYTAERRNVFDDEVVDVSKLHVGKKSVPEQGTPQDREAAERMKAEILRRVEEMDAEDAQSEVSDTELGISPGKGKARDVAYEEELEMDDVVRVRGDGSAESESDEGNGTDDEKEGPSVRQTPETVLELAFIRDPKLFDRDAKTRRDKARTDLKTQTGWGDEQIEGWKIMFERMPQAQRDRILQKHEFRGNRALPGPADERAPAANAPPRGRGGGGGGRGSGRGRGGRGGGGGGNEARERAWKDKNKASRGNHNRKRGHDKKMARAAPPAL